MSEQTVLARITALERMSVAELVVEYEAVVGKPPRIKRKDFLKRELAWHIQAAVYGGLSEDTERRLDEIIETLDVPLGQGAPSAPRRPRQARGRDDGLAVGTVLVRPYKGQDVRVTVVEHGIEWNGVVYSSLTAAAKAITGSKWNGKLFFGLTPRANSR